MGIPRPFPAAFRRQWRAGRRVGMGNGGGYGRVWRLSCGRAVGGGGGSGRGELFGREAAEQVGRAGQRRSPEACTRPAVRHPMVGLAGVGGGGRGGVQGGGHRPVGSTGRRAAGSGRVSGVGQRGPAAGTGGDVLAARAAWVRSIRSGRRVVTGWAATKAVPSGGRGGTVGMVGECPGDRCLSPGRVSGMTGRGGAVVSGGRGPAELRRWAGQLNACLPGEFARVLSKGALT